MPTPYAGNPASYPASVPLLSGSDLPSMVNFNATSEGLADRTAWLAQQVKPEDAVDWSPAFSAATGFLGHDFVGGAAYGPLSGEWCVAATHIDSSVPIVALQFFTSLGLDAGAPASWTALTSDGLTDSTRFVCIVEDPSSAGKWWSGWIGPGSAVNIMRYSGSAWVYSTYSPPIGVTGGVANISACTLGAYTIIAVACATPNALAFYSSDDPTLAAYSTYGTAVPAMPAGSFWSLKSNGAMALAIPSGATTLGPATGVWKTTDGITWSVAATLSFLAASDEVVALAWSPGLGLWFACIQTTTPTVYFYSSPDGVSWSSVGAGPASHLAVADMASVGDALVCTLPETTSGGASGAMFSIDGGVTWYPTAALLFSNEAPSYIYGYTRIRIAASPQGFLLNNNLWGRFSTLSGLPGRTLLLARVGPTPLGSHLRRARPARPHRGDPHRRSGRRRRRANSTAPSWRLARSDARGAGEGRAPWAARGHLQGRARALSSPRQRAWFALAELTHDVRQELARQGQ